MTKYKIVLVPFPFDDLSSNKVRPAVCLTDPIGRNRHVVLAFITSRVPSSPLPTDLIIDQNNIDFPATGLIVSSTIQFHRLMTVTTSLFKRELGKLSHTLQLEAQARIKILYDL